jgi:hypothetical protein
MKNTLIIASVSLGLMSCDKQTFNKVDINVIEKCETFSQIDLRQSAIETWQLQTDGGKTYDFPNYNEAYKSKRLLENYKASSLCKCGDGIYTNENGEENYNGDFISYQLREDGEGIGNEQENSYDNGVEDCLPFEPDRLIAKKNISGDWYLVEKPDHSLFGFGKDKEACINTLKVIKKYEFNQTCFVGRPNPSFTYLKSYKSDTPKITTESLQ